MSRKRPPARRELLLNGRRVRITDLIDAERLKPGQRLYFTHRIGETPYEAVVTERGRLRLDDGREFSTPSAAAANAEISPNSQTVSVERKKRMEDMPGSVGRRGQ